MGEASGQITSRGKSLSRFLLSFLHGGVWLHPTSPKAGYVFHVLEKGIKLHKTMCVYTEEYKCMIT